jgi:hypothetical protein
METPQVHERNADQAAYWGGAAGQRFVEGEARRRGSRG